VRRVFNFFLALLTIVPLAAQAQEIITTVAGEGANNNPAHSQSVCVPASFGGIFAGNYYILSCNRVYQVTPSGQWTVVAGTGTFGFSGDGGPATSATFNNPQGVFVDGSGNIFIADSSNQRIRKVAAGTGIITTVAGTGTAGFSGDGGPATSAQLDFPLSVFVDSSGNIWIVDISNSRIREVVAATGNIRTVAGNGSFGSNGDGGQATSAQLSNPHGVFVDSLGNIFIADSLNYRIREVAAGTGIITTVAGTGTAGFRGDGGPATSAQLGYPAAVFGDGSGNILIADENNIRIRKITAVPAVRN